MAHGRPEHCPETPVNYPTVPLRFLIPHGLPEMQVQRLVAVLSVPAVTRGALLADGAPDLAQSLPPADAAVLAAAGWTPQCGLRALLNFSGDFPPPSHLII